MAKKKVALLILDGWGIGNNPKIDATLHANTPYFDSLLKSAPNATLEACGEAVGLPPGQMGNSEVGHINIGAGRVVYQELARINKSMGSKEFHNLPMLKSAFSEIKKTGKTVHFMGLVSDGGVHAHINHLKELCNAAEMAGINEYFIHAFSDGRDTDPHGGKKYLTDLEDFLKDKKGKIATLIGRYFAMDRDKRWERVAKAYDLLVRSKGEKFNSSLEAIDKAYADGQTDEFVEPKVIVDEKGNPLAAISDDDLVICFNFRTDRGRQITEALTQRDVPEFGMKTLKLKYITMSKYDDIFKGVEVIYHKDNLIKTLGEVISANGLKQVRIAETEKYPHVTFFFNGGREEPFEGEKRLLVNSPKVATYDLQPEMSAPEITASICKEIKENTPDFICLNFANPDMVGHTGVFDAVKKACEIVDKCLKEVVEAGVEKGYEFIIIADHGNADYMMNQDGSPNTAHSLNLVPIILLNSKPGNLIKSGVLGDVAPTILELLEVEKPTEMTGKSLIEKT